METNTLATGSRKRLHLGAFGDPEPHAYVLDASLAGSGPRFTGTSSDPSVVVLGDGGDYRIAAIAVGTSTEDRTATLTITRVSDGVSFDLPVTVLGVPAADLFEAHLGETF